jgi:hypothetical protein
MGQKGNLTTVRLNFLSLNLSNINRDFFLLGLNFLKSFKQLLLLKNVTVIKDYLNYGLTTVSLKAFFFFGTNKLKLFSKKNTFQQSPKKDSKLKTKNSLFNLLKNSFKNYSFKNFSFDIVVLNPLINKKFLSYIYLKTKFYIRILFSRRFSFYIDFLKITTLFFQNKVDLKTFLYFITQVFKFILKKSHSKFFAFIEKIFIVLLNYKIKNSSIQGFKFLINGRLRGKQMAGSYGIQKGSTFIQSIDANVTFSKSYTFISKLGTFGFKLWVSKKN